MIGKFFLVIARNNVIGKGDPDGHSFDSVDVIMLRDFYQFHPVAKAIRDALLGSIRSPLTNEGLITSSRLVLILKRLIPGVVSGSHRSDHAESPLSTLHIFF